MRGGGGGRGRRQTGPNPSEAHGRVSRESPVDQGL